MIWVLVLIKVQQWRTHFVFFSCMIWVLPLPGAAMTNTVSLWRQSGFFPLPGAVMTNTVSLQRQSGFFPLPDANTLFFLSSQVQSGFFLFQVQRWQTQFLCEDSLGFFLFQVQRWQSGVFPVPDANTLFFLSSQVQSGFCLFQVRSRCWAAQLYRRCTARWGRPSCGSAPSQVRRQLWRSSPLGTGATPSLTTRWEKPRKQRAGRVRSFIGTFDSLVQKEKEENRKEKEEAIVNVSM